MKLLSLVALAVIAFSGIGTANAQDATIQIIHNSPDPAASTVDIYVNAGAEPAIVGLAFRAATGLVTLPADTDLAVGIAPGGSTGPEDIIATWTYNLPAGSMTVVMANGILGNDFDLFVNALETSAPMGEVGVLAFHGAQDAPAVDIGADGVGVLVPGLEYQAFAGYISVPAASYVLTVAPAGGDPIAAFDAPLSGLAGGAAVVFASGFLAAEPTFGLFAALSDGTVIELPANNTVAAEDATMGQVKSLYR